MTRLALISAALLTTLGCRPPSTPNDPPPLVEEPTPTTEDAGSTTPDSGTTTHTALACPAIPITPQCDAFGRCWKNPRPMATQPLSDVWSHGCTAWAVGPAGMLLERKSTGWAPLTDYSTRVDLYALAGTDTDDVWAVGANSTILHFDGTRWTQLQSTWGTQTFRAAWTNQRDVVFIAGDEGVYRFERHDWRTSLTTLLAPADTHFTSVSGSTDSAGNTVIHALGSEISRASNQVTWTYDGRDAIREPMRADGYYARLLELDGRVYAAGARQMNGSYRANFSQLFPMQAPSSTTDLAVSFSGLAASATNDFIIAGSGYPNSVMRFDGFSLKPIASSPSGDARAVSFSGERDYFVVGEHLGRVSDDTWIAESEGPTQTFTNVLSFENGDTWVSGGFRSQLDGPLTATFTEPNQYLGEVAGLASDSLLATSSGTGLWKFDGTRWAPLPNGPTEWVRHVVTAPTGETWAWNDLALWTNSGGSWVKVVPDQAVFVVDVLVLESGLTLVSSIDGTQTPQLFACTTSRCSARPTPALFTHLAGHGLFDFFGITSDGKIWRNDDNTWTEVATLLETNVLDAAVRPNDDTLVMAGANGTVATWGGSRVFTQSVGAAVGLFGIGFTSTGQNIAVGTGGAVVTF